MKIQKKSDSKEVRILINDKLHLHFLKNDYIGFQSWLEGGYETVNYFIKISFKSTSILTEYDEREIWEKILEELGKSV